MSELKIAQPMLIKDFKAEYAGAIAYKQSHAFLAGVPDLRLAHLSTGEWNIEVKWLGHLPKTYVVHLDLSTLQRQWGIRAKLNGLNWGWCLVVKDGYKGHWIFAGGDPATEQIPTILIRTGPYRRRGETWIGYDPIRQIRRA